MGINVKSSEVYLGLSMMGQWRGLVSRTEKSIEGSQWWVNCELIQTCEKYINDLQWWIDGELMQRCEKWIESSQWLICSWLSGAWIITLLVKHEFIKNRRVVDSNPAMDIGRHGPPIHSVVKWVPGIWTGMTSQLTLALFFSREMQSWVSIYCRGGGGMYFIKFSVARISTHTKIDPIGSKVLWKSMGSKRL